VSVLVLHYRGSLAGFPYDSWLSDYDGDVLLLASREHLRWVGEELPTGRTGYRHMEALDGYEVGGVLEDRALRLAREYRVEHIIACQEHDLVRAAQLREILGLGGQSVASAVPFRNKLTMKATVAAAGIEVAAHRAVECAADVLSFASEHGFPIVLKPRDGAGSIGVRVIRTFAELTALLTDEFDIYGSYQSNLMVESFVDGPMCHVDGLVVNGRIAFIWPSQYQFALASFKDARRGKLDVTLDPDDPLTTRLIGFTERVLAALPSPDTFSFHAEVFHTPDDRLVLCEIACRTGGAQNRGVAHTLFGVDPTECAVRAQVGLPLPIDTGPDRRQPARMGGQLVFNKRPGTVLAVPRDPPFPWVRRSKIFVAAGDVMPVPRYSADFLASFVVSAPNRDTCLERLRELEAWFLRGLVIDEHDGGARTELAAS
jgi:biotin carboxylase